MLYSYILMYICIWWVIFYMALPFKVKVKEKNTRGLADSAPLKPHLNIKFWITSIIAAMITYLVIFLINEGYIKFLAEKYLKFIGQI